MAQFQASLYQTISQSTEKSGNTVVVGPPSFVADNTVTKQDFLTAQAYWLPRDGIIRLTREALREAYTWAREVGLQAPQPSAYNKPTGAQAWRPDRNGHMHPPEKASDPV